MGSLVIADDGDYIRRDSSSADWVAPSRTAFSMSGWVKLTSSTAGTERYLCGIGLSGESAGIVQWSDNNIGVVGGTLGNGFSTQPGEDVWIYVAMTYDDTVGPKGYWWNASGTYQGVSDTSNPMGAGTVTSCVVGARGFYADNRRNGKYAHWRAWNAILSQSDFEAELESATVVKTTDFLHGFADSSDGVSPETDRTWTLNGTGTDSDTPPVTLGVEETATPSSGLLYVC